MLEKQSPMIDYVSDHGNKVAFSNPVPRNSLLGNGSQKMILIHSIYNTMLSLILLQVVFYHKNENKTSAIG